MQDLNLSKNQLTELPETIGKLTQLQTLNLSNNQLTELPEAIGKLTQLQMLNLDANQLTKLPKSFINLESLTNLDMYNHPLEHFPKEILKLTKLENLDIQYLDLRELPFEISQLTNLKLLFLHGNQLTDLPPSLAQLEHLKELELDNNPLNPELAAAYKEGLPAVMAYLRAKEGGEIVLNEAKLILIGEGGVGKTSLLAALRGDDWEENRETTHGVEVDIKSLVVKCPDSGKEITLNGWDFGGPKERLDHIDEQAIRDEFGDLICGFYHVDSKPGEDGKCYQLDELKEAIGREAAAIPTVGRKVPTSWKKVLEAIRRRSERDPYILYSRFEALCNRQGVSNELAVTYATILNELGHLIYYRGDDTLKDTVILKPDYLSKAVSFILEDKATKDAKGLIEHDRLSEIWYDPSKPADERYPQELHPVFLRLMQRFDLSYQVVMPNAGTPATSLMAQLVPGIRPDGWEADWVLKTGDAERTQVCRVLDAETGRTVEAEGLMYRLIVRLHRYSLGRNDYHLSRHWKTGMILDDNFNGRAFIEEIGGDIYVTVRAAYPFRFLSHLSYEIQWLVEHFWKGLDARLFVPCETEGCKGLLELGEIMDFKGAGMPKVRCSVCQKFHEIDSLLATMQPKPEWGDAVAQLRSGQRHILQAQDIGFGQLSTQLRILMSQADEQYDNLLKWLSDPAKEGPRLFSFVPVNHSKFDPRSWTKERFKLILWCEHAQLPLPFLNGSGSDRGVIEIELTREWFKTAAPFLKFLTGTLSLVLPVASSGFKLAIPETIYDAMANQLDFGQEIIDASLSGTEKIVDWLDTHDDTEFERGKLISAQGSVLRELHSLLKEKDPGFGGLVRVQNKRREFLWVHEQFKGEY